MALFDVVQATAKAASAASVTQNWPTKPIAKNLLIAFAQSLGNPPDVAGFLPVFTPLQADGGTNLYAGMFYKIADGTETSVTASTSSSSRVRIHVMEVDAAGLDVSLLDALTNSTDGAAASATNSWQIPSLTVDQEAFLIGAISTENTVTSWTGAWSQGYVVASSYVGAGFSPSSEVATLHALTAGTFAPSESWSSTRQVLAAHAAFVIGSGPPPPANPVKVRRAGAWVDSEFKRRLSGSWL